MARKLAEDGPVKLTEANKLYFYQLLGDSLGIGKQAFLPRAEEALAEAEISPERLGYADARQLFAALDDVVRLTSFKGGRFYVTVIRNEAWDTALAQADSPKTDGGKAGKGGKAKPWKRKKGSLKPQRPKLRELAAENTAETEMRAEPAPEAAPLDAAPETKTAAETASSGAASEMWPASNAEAKTEAAPKMEAAPKAKAEVEASVPEVAPETGGAEESGPRPGKTSEPKPEELTGTKAEPLGEVAAVAPSAGYPAAHVAAKTEPATAAAARPTLLEQIEAQAALLRGIDSSEDTEGAQGNNTQEAQGAHAEESQDANVEVSQTSESSQSQAAGIAQRGSAGPNIAQEASGGSPAQVVVAAPAQSSTATPTQPSASSPAHAVAAAPARPATTTPGDASPRDMRPGRFARATQPREGARAHDDLPRSFADEVSIKPALFGLLTRLLPIDADLMRVLDEDLRVARATGLAAGSRSRVTFPLRYLQEDGSAPVSITIRKTTKPGEARRWQLALVDGDDGTGNAHESVGLEGLPEANSGYWDDLAPRTSEAAPADPIREMAQFMIVGPWETFLGTVATAAAPENWNYPGEGVGKASRYGILRDYLATTLARVRAAGQLCVAASNSLAAFDTGLVSPMSERLFAVLEPTGSDIPWRFAGIASAGSGELGSKLVATFDELPSQACYLESIDDVRPRPDALVIPDYRALLGAGLSHLPRLFLAAQLEGTDAEGLLAATESENRHERTEALRGLARTIAGNPGRYRRVCRALDDAIDLSLAAARQSYRHVAPAWDPARNRKLLLLPLALVDDTQVDCALTLELMPSGAYQAASVMPLSRAYAAARAISREMPAWLAL